MGTALAQNLFPTKGSVGIGTSQPTKLLDVNGDTRVNGWLWMDSPETTAPRIQSTKQLFLQSANDQPIMLNPFNGGGDVYIGGPQSRVSNLLIRGKVGVGTDSPQTKVHVAGDATVDGELKLTGSVASGSRVISNQRLILQTLNNQPIALNPFDGGGDISVGKNLLVNGKVTSQTLELTSDRNQKTKLESVSAVELLVKVAALPSFSWVFTNSPTVKHIGPMAQDFRAAFNLGEDEKHIAAGDGIGVALAAIKGLHELVVEKDSQLRTLEKRLADQERSLAERLAVIEKAIGRENVSRGTAPSKNN